MTDTVAYASSDQIERVTELAMADGLLDYEALAAIGTRVMGKPVTWRGVSKIVRESQQGLRPQDPFPEPDGVFHGSPFWFEPGYGPPGHVSKVAEIEAWFGRHSPARAEEEAARVARNAALEAAQWLSRADVAAIGGVKGQTVTQHLYESNETIGQGAKARRGKYAHDPFPEPDGPDPEDMRQWRWSKTRRPEIEAWFGRHPRRQVGDRIGGRKPRVKS